MASCVVLCSVARPGSSLPGLFTIWESGQPPKKPGLQAAASRPIHVHLQAAKDRWWGAYLVASVSSSCKLVHPGLCRLWVRSTCLYSIFNLKCGRKWSQYNDFRVMKYCNKGARHKMTCSPYHMISCVTNIFIDTLKNSRIYPKLCTLGFLGL